MKVMIALVFCLVAICASLPADQSNQEVNSQVASKQQIINLDPRFIGEEEYQRAKRRAQFGFIGDLISSAGRAIRRGFESNVARRTDRLLSGSGRRRSGRRRNRCRGRRCG